MRSLAAVMVHTGCSFPASFHSCLVYIHCLARMRCCCRCTPRCLQVSCAACDTCHAWLLAGGATQRHLEGPYARPVDGAAGGRAGVLPQGPLRWQYLDGSNRPVGRLLSPMRQHSMECLLCNCSPACAMPLSCPPPSLAAGADRPLHGAHHHGPALTPLTSVSATNCGSNHWRRC